MQRRGGFSDSIQQSRKMTNPTSTVTAQNFVLTGSRDPLDIAKLNLVLDHLSTEPGAYIALLSAADRGANVNINHSGVHSFDPGMNTISWDPTMALATLHPDLTVAGVSSPALTFLHEVAHLLDPNLAANAAIPDAAWETQAEVYAATVED